MSTHPDTIVCCDGNWFDKSRFLENIPQPACISVGIPNIFHETFSNIFIQMEPSIINNYDDYLIQNQNKYDIIFTYHKKILDNCKNARFMVHGTTWIPKEHYLNIDLSKKEFKISTLAGTKLINSAPGHRFRQNIHHNQNILKEFPITFFRSFFQRPHITDYGNNPFITTDSKISLFETFQFAIIIENSQQTNYFTEKIVDCLITKTIPIYWGCPNISDFFNTNGWIILNTDSLDELYNKLKNLNADYYSKYENVIEFNYKKAIDYSDIYQNINNAK